MPDLRQLLSRLNPSLLTRVAVALTAVGLLPVLLLAWRLIGVNRSAMANQVETSHVLAARSKAESVGAFLSARLALATGLAGHAALEDPRSAEARALLGRSLQAWAALGVTAIAVVNEAGEQVIVAQLNDAEAKRRAEPAFALDPSLEVAAAGASDRPVIRVSSPLPGGRGAVWIVTDGEQLVDTLDAYELGEEAEIALADGSGEVLVGTLSGFSGVLLERARSTWIGGADPAFHLGEGSEEQIGAHAPVPFSSWTVLSRQPARVARAAEQGMRRQAAVAMGLTALVVAALSIVAYGSVVRPIRQLAAAQRRLAGVPGAKSSGDEIDQLRSSFELLEKRLRDREAVDEVFLGRYQVIEVVGAGAMGTVFRGWDPKLERPVALKTVRLGAKLDLGRRQELIQRLLQEAVTVAKFNHPNIVAVFDVEDRPEAAYVAMEFIDGVSLESLMWQAERLAESQIVPLGLGIARALESAHQNGLVHRDIKPANVLLGTDDAIKVTDFGIAELMTSISGAEDVVFGTPGYLPPETLQGRGYDASGDLFSLGAVLYYCITGERPFEGNTVRDVIRRTLFGRVTPPSQVVSGVSPELERLIVELLTVDPKQRPSDAGLVAERLAVLAAAGPHRWRYPVEVIEAGAGAGDDDGKDSGQLVRTTRLPGAAA